MKVIKITEELAQRAKSIASRSNVSVVFHNNNFYGSYTVVGAEVFSSSHVTNPSDINDLCFLNEDREPVFFQL